MDGPSRHAVAVQLGPTQGISPTVYLSDDAHAISARVRQDLSDFVEHKLQGRARMIEPRGSTKLRHAFAAYEFAVGTLPQEALLLVRKARSWFFQNLTDVRDQRAERMARKVQQKAARMAKRRERHQVRRLNRCFRGAADH